MSVHEQRTILSSDLNLLKYITQFSDERSLTSKFLKTAFVVKKCSQLAFAEMNRRARPHTGVRVAEQGLTSNLDKLDYRTAAAICRTNKHAFSKPTSLKAGVYRVFLCSRALFSIFLLYH